MWQSYRQKDSNYDDGVWKESVQQFYDGCRKATWKFDGPSYDLANEAVRSFELYLTKLIYFTYSNSTVLQSSSTALLQSLSKCKRLEKTGFNIIKEFEIVLLGLVKDLNEIVEKLSEIIGDLTCTVNDALNELGYTFSYFMKEFLKLSTAGRRNKVSYEPVLKKLQKLMNTVALIAETLINECEEPTQEENEAVSVLELISIYFALAIQGINTCVQDVIYKEKCSVSQNIESCSVSLEYVVVEVTQSVALVTLPFTESLKAMLTNFVNITMFLNAAWKDIFGIFEGVPITVEDITKHLSKAAKGSSRTDKKLSRGPTNILKGIIPK